MSPRRQKKKGRGVVVKKREEPVEDKKKKRSLDFGNKLVVINKRIKPAEKVQKVLQATPVKNKKEILVDATPTTNRVFDDLVLATPD